LQAVRVSSIVSVMDIQQATNEKQVKTIMLRLTPSVYDQCKVLAKRARRPLAAICREIIEGALSEGIQVVPPTPAVTVK